RNRGGIGFAGRKGGIPGRLPASHSGSRSGGRQMARRRLSTRANVERALLASKLLRTFPLDEELDRSRGTWSEPPWDAIGEEAFHGKRVRRLRRAAQTDFRISKHRGEPWLIWRRDPRCPEALELVAEVTDKRRISDLRRGAISLSVLVPSA